MQEKCDHIIGFENIPYEGIVHHTEESKEETKTLLIGWEAFNYCPSCGEVNKEKESQ